MSGYDCLNKNVFNSGRKVDSEFATTTSVGSVFQMCGAATAKARLPTVERLTGGATRRLELVERVFVDQASRRHNIRNVKQVVAVMAAASGRIADASWRLTLSIPTACKHLQPAELPVTSSTSTVGKSRHAQVGRQMCPSPCTDSISHLEPQTHTVYIHTSQTARRSVHPLL